MFSKRNSGTIKHLSDFLLDLIIEGDDSFYPLIRQEFENISRELIPDISMPKVKVRELNPLVNGKRVK